MSELAEAVSAWVGRPIPYKNLSGSEYKHALTQAGLPAPFVELFVAIDVSIARGDLDSSSRDLHALIGRDTHTLRDVLAGLPNP